MQAFYQNAPPELLSKAVPLDALGVNEVAWTSADVQSVIDWCAAHGFAILGGDVLRHGNGFLRYDSANWYVEHKDDSQNWNCFVQLCSNRARDYITSFQLKNWTDCLFTIQAISEAEYHYIATSGSIHNK